MESKLNLFACPKCRGNVKLEKDYIECLICNERFSIKEGIPNMFVWHENAFADGVTKSIKDFYEENPFPNYESFENIGDLIEKAKKSVFANLLNEQLPFNVNVLEVGCGTGQLSNYLATSNRYVFGTDMCENSLLLGNKFKNDNDLERVGFYQMNLFKPVFKEKSFDFVICNGVLHHTNDPYTGFVSIAKLVKDGGYIIVGLYNKYTRLITDIRRRLFNTFGTKLKYLDPRLRNVNVGDLKKHIWYMDQYKNPHESKHTMDEVLNWFKENNFEFINSIPPTKLFSGFDPHERLFAKHPLGTKLERILKQITQIPQGSTEGGFFIMIGKKHG